MKSWWWISVLLLVGSFEPNEHSGSGSMQVVFYNVENLFDTLDQPGVADGDFLPGAKKQWNSERYHAKISMLARVLNDALDGKPGIIGLAEVENRQVLEDLCRDPQLSSFGLRILHQESSDHRGIDVCLLLPPEVSLLEARFLIPQLPGKKQFKTRNIIMARCVLSSDTIWFSVCHFPSRLGGQEKTEGKRLAVARQMRQFVDSVTRYGEPHFLIMGDFNDEPGDSSLAHGLKIRKQRIEGEYFLVNPMAENGGTYYYRGKWMLLDQFLTSGSLLDDGARRALRALSAEIFRRNYLLRNGQPWRTYQGNQYLGGYSDHLPICLKLRYH